MIYGLYLSAQGAEAQTRRLDVIANNLANAGTTAFKRDLAVFQAHRPFDLEHGLNHDLPGDLQQATGGVTLADIVTDHAGGPLVQTGGAFDAALSGPGFFRVDHGGESLLTRNGEWTVDADGMLVDRDTGDRLLARGGNPISLPKETETIEVAGDGSIYPIVGGAREAAVAQLDIVQVPAPDALEKVGESLYRVHGDVVPAAESDVQVQQGYIEGSGTRPVNEMLEMIQASRAFETNVNVMKLQDDALHQLLQTLPPR